ncbi:methyltransferase domain-containing protein [Microbispora sp. ZYX-F-249]|uniref:Protein-L-isoaspartate O-methyltransferase n=1 Tax=Microbispora maris TaxID=3144104 RepID=A0ABV0ALC9_9ACTN
MNADERNAGLVERLPEIDDRWRDAFRAVPRHLFIPERAWCVSGAGSRGQVIDQAADPERWLDAVYSNIPIVTQVDDGAADIADLANRHHDFTSSSSMPGIVATELDLLDPYEGDKVLEIGTGTGWTAALLAHRLGPEHVTSVEIDPALHEAAAENLKRAGHSPRLVLGDGTEGWPEGGPYDHVHVTCGVRRVPHAWIAQTRPGGTIVLPWMTGWGGHMVRLTVAAGGTAVGRFHHPCGFMLLRSQRGAGGQVEGDYRDSRTDLDPRRVARPGRDADLALGGMLPGVNRAFGEVDDGEFRLWLSSADSEAEVRHMPGDRQAVVRQRGPRDLWDEAEAAFLRWVCLGSPGRDRFGLTVTAEEQYVWLDLPDRQVTP